jgi:hypothetical protein
MKQKHKTQFELVKVILHNINKEACADNDEEAKALSWLLIETIGEGE